MPKITDEALIRVQVRLYRADYERIASMSGSTDAASASKIIRAIVRSFVRQREAELRQKIDALEGRKTVAVEATATPLPVALELDTLDV